MGYFAMIAWSNFQSTTIPKTSWMVGTCLFSSSSLISSLKIDKHVIFAAFLAPIIHLKLKKWRFANRFFEPMLQTNSWNWFFGDWLGMQSLPLELVP
jgi:hypothetical protein